MELITQLEKQYRKPALPQVQTGDTVRVHQLIKEGNKQRIQVFEGVVIRRHRMSEVTATITVRRIASGVGVEKTFLMHSPNVSKIEILRRAKVRRNFLSFLRERRGKSARLKEIAFDKAAANDVTVPEAVADEPEVIEAEENQDALNGAEPLSEVTNAENREAQAEDEPSTADVDTSSEQEAPADEVESGVDRAEPGEGEAVKS
ncbi:MAG TPA: 50S ribosomal protein L19 [Candidatus Saccharimonadia bacterium]